MADSFEQLRAEFLAETEDTLENLQRDLNDLGQAMDSGALPESTIDRVFRTTHSLKGVAGMFGLDSMSAVSHAMENVFESLRRGDVALDSELLDALHRGNEALHQLLGEADSADAPDNDSDRVIREIQQVLLERLPEAAAGDNVVASAILRLDFAERESARTAHENGRAVVAVQAQLPEEGFEAPFRELLDTARTWGTVHGTVSGNRDEATGTFLVWIVVSGPTEVFPLLQLVGPLGADVLFGEPGFDAAESGADDTAPPDDSASAEETSEGDTDPPLTLAGGFTIDPEVITALTPSAAPRPVDGGADAPGEGLHSEPSRRTATLRVPVERVDRLLTELGHLIQAKMHLDETADSLFDGSLDRMSRTMLRQSLRTLDRHIRTLQDGVLGVRLVALEPMFQRLERTFRDVCRSTGKDARLEMAGEDAELDKEIVDALGEPLIHLIRNAVDHGLEDEGARIAAGKPPQGTVRIAASTEGPYTMLEVSDDGAGIDYERVRERAEKNGLLPEGRKPTRAELREILFHPGFTMKEEITEVSGRGVGLDVVRHSLQRIGGVIEIEDAPVGTVFRLRVPISLAIAQALEVQVGDQSVFVPLAYVQRVFRVGPDELDRIADEPVYPLDDCAIPVRRLEDVLCTVSHPDEGRSGVLLAIADRRLLLLVDRVGKRREIVVRSLGEALGNVAGLSGCTELGDGRTLLILDPMSLFETAVPPEVVG